VIRVGRRVLVRQEAVERWLQAHETPAKERADPGEPETLPTPGRLAQALENSAEAEDA
jgi:hypothetical protein